MGRTVNPVATLVAGLAAGQSPVTKPRPLEGTGTGWPAGAALVAGPEPRLHEWRGRDRLHGGTLRHWTRLTSIIMDTGLSYRKKWTRL